MTGIELQAS
jgi:hypothetical protein